MRTNGRRPDELRTLDIRPDFLEQPHGSVLYGQGKTLVLCTATVEESVPRWLYGKGRGWMTAEYSMLPASTGERTLWLDCDVLQADGGTRCASITGAWIAASLALERFGLSKALAGSVAAVSVGIVDGEAVLDLDYTEDSSADTDMNVVMTGDGRLIEVQATAERDPFARETLDELLELAAAGIADIGTLQAEAVERELP